MYKAEDANKKSLFEKFTDWHRNRLCETQLIEPIVDYFEFPILWTRRRPLLQHLFFIFKAYLKEVEVFLPNPQSEDGNLRDAEKSDLLGDIHYICNEIISSLSNLYLMKEGKAEEHLCHVIDRIGIKAEKIKAKKLTFFKVRPDQQDLVCELDFLHIPFDKRYLASQQRFSAMALPCLYLGFSKEVCVAEVGKSGSMAEFKIKESLNILDLTVSNEKCQKDSCYMFKLWPLLAACYVAVPRELDNGRKVNFKEEYLFPQLLTRNYVKANGESSGEHIDGICYYSCRNRDLDPLVDNYKNLVLFAKEQIKENQDILKDYSFGESSVFDQELKEKVKFIKAYNL